MAKKRPFRIAAELFWREEPHSLIYVTSKPSRDALVALFEGPGKVLNLDDLPEKCSPCVVLTARQHFTSSCAQFASHLQKRAPSARLFPGLAGQLSLTRQAYAYFNERIAHAARCLEGVVPKAQDLPNRVATRLETRLLPVFRPFSLAQCNRELLEAWGPDAQFH